MIKKCNICGHTGELTWRNGKYYCAMCGSEIAETDPVVQPQPQAYSSTAINIACPICKNSENNQFDGLRYRCALCGTPFDLQQATQAQQYGQFDNTSNFAYEAQRQDLKQKRDRNVIIGIVCIFLFWPAAVYFFYKAYKNHTEMKELGV